MRNLVEIFATAFVALLLIVICAWTQGVEASPSLLPGFFFLLSVPVLLGKLLYHRVLWCKLRSDVVEFALSQTLSWVFCWLALILAFAGVGDIRWAALFVLAAIGYLSGLAGSVLGILAEDFFARGPRHIGGRR